MNEDQSKPSSFMLKMWTGLFLLAIIFPPVNRVTQSNKSNSFGAYFDGFRFIGDDFYLLEIAIPILVLELAVITLVSGVWWKLGDK